jgi:hypothetical protein
MKADVPEVVMLAGVLRSSNRVKPGRKSGGLVRPAARRWVRFNGWRRNQLLGFDIRSPGQGLGGRNGKG